jgi:mono/diheme cytochrome c family protein
MRLLISVVLFVAVIAGAVLLASRIHTARGDDLASRGQYLVRDAGNCADCHGATLRGQFLRTLRPGLPIAYTSADIAGLKQMTTAQAVMFFETGVLPNGLHAAPPMPQFRYNSDDARAIVAYLRSLN